MGFSTIELLLAMAIAILVMSAVLMTVGVDQTTVTDSEINAEALHKAQDLVEAAAATARTNYASVAPVPLAIETSGGLQYTKSLAIPTAHVGPCSEIIVGTVSWTGTYSRSLSVSATTTVVNMPEVFKFGGDCSIGNGDGWTKPRRFASYKFNPGQPTSVDVLNRIVYMPDNFGNLNIADTSGATFGFTTGTFVSPTFNVGVDVNDIDVAIQSGTGKKYAYVARNDASDQFQVIDVSNINSPSSVVTMPLAGVNPLNAFAQGWRIFYYDNHVYVATRYTNGGPEFHIFDVSAPASSFEIGGGTVVGTSVYGIAVRDQFVGGSTHRFAYLVTTHDDKEVIVLDITNPSAVIPLTAAYTNIPGNKDGRSIYMVGNRIYVGLESGSGEELYVLDATDPLSATAGLPILGKAEIGAGASVNAIRVSGSLAFLATTKTNDEFQVWNISNPSATITRVDTSPYNIPNNISKGIDFEAPYIYAASQANDPLQILYSAP